MVAAVDSQSVARQAGLRFVSDRDPGIARHRRGRGFTYRDPDGRTLRGPDRRRVEALALPPAWEGVWISVDDAGHLQATGRDARRRKQYRYHDRWGRTVRRLKFARMADFGAALPRVRRRVREALKEEAVTPETAVAAVVRLLDRGHLRVGNAEYTRRNGTFGATTLRPRHVRVRDGRVELDYRGKHGVRRHVELCDRLLAPVLKKLAGRGRRLFSFEDEAGVRHRVTADRVNDWLREAAGGPFTAKDFRTWHGSADVLEELLTADPGRPRKTDVTAAIKSAAASLGNTPATCRNHYVHPRVCEAFLSGDLARHADAAPVGELRSAEASLLSLLGEPTPRPA